MTARARRVITVLTWAQFVLMLAALTIAIIALVTP